MWSIDARAWLPVFRDLSGPAFLREPRTIQWGSTMFVSTIDGHGGPVGNLAMLAMIRLYAIY